MDSDKLIDEFLKESCTYGEFVNQMKALCRQGHPDAVTVVSLLSYLYNEITELRLEFKIEQLKHDRDDLAKRVRYLEGRREL